MRAEPAGRISRKALTVWRIGALFPIFIIGVFIGGYTYLSLRNDWLTWVLALVYGLGVIFFIFNVIIVPQLRWKRWRYEIKEHEVDIKHGVLVVTRTLIPMVRVQHVDTIQGPLLRKFGLSSVTIATAATVHVIPALENEEAEQIRDRIAELARVVEDDV